MNLIFVLNNVPELTRLLADRHNLNDKQIRNW